MLIQKQFYFSTMSKKVELSNLKRQIRANNFRKKCKIEKYTLDQSMAQSTSSISDEQNCKKINFNTNDYNEKVLYENEVILPMCDSGAESDDSSSCLSETFSNDYISSCVSEDDINDSDTYDSDWHIDQSNEKIVQDLKQWSFEFNVNRLYLDKLLKLLHTRIPELPLCAKTLQKLTGPSLYKIIPFDDNSEFIYFGISDQLKKLINPSLHLDNSLKLQFNVDGLPLYQSSSKEFWSILGKILFKPDI